MEAFLREQLKRIQELSEQMSSLERRAAELTSERARERNNDGISHGPLADVRDLRTYSSVNDRPSQRSTAADEPRRRNRRR